MTTLLRIDSSPNGGERSFSRQLTGEFVQEWRRKHPDGRIVERDLASSGLQPIHAEWIQAMFAPEASRTAEQREMLAVSDQLIAELYEADEYVFGVAMHNFSIPSVLKLWIDLMVRPGKTFSYESGKVEGLLGGKQATVLVASGLEYQPGTPMAAMNFIEPYLQTLFGFLGVTEVRFVHAGGTSRSRYGVDRQTILEPAVASIQAQFRTASV